MARKLRTYQLSETKKPITSVPHIPTQGMFDPRPLELESQPIAPQQPLDLNAELMRAQRYGHNLTQMQSAEPASDASTQPEKMRGQLLRSPLPPRQLPQHLAIENSGASGSNRMIQAKGNVIGNRQDSSAEQRPIQTAPGPEMKRTESPRRRILVQGSAGESENTGSLYFQSEQEKEKNFGHRLRLEHPGGPQAHEDHMSYRRSVSTQEYDEIQENPDKKERNQELMDKSKSLKPNEGMEEGTKLIETRKEEGPVTHRSRGRLRNMEPITDDQYDAIKEVGVRSDKSRERRLKDEQKDSRKLSGQNKKEHAQKYNHEMRQTLMSDTFAGHQLHDEAIKRQQSEE